MKTIIIVAAATLMAGTAFAQTNSDGPIVVLSEVVVVEGMPSYTSANTLEEYDVYGADGKKIADIEDVLLNMDGTVAAVALEVGGFLGIDAKHVLVNWKALQVAPEDNGRKLRITAPTLTKEELEKAASVNLKALGLHE
jgi:sporulation protein YlmC with PRC-barrel domain